VSVWKVGGKFVQQRKEGEKKGSGVKEKKMVGEGQTAEQVARRQELEQAMRPRIEQLLRDFAGQLAANLDRPFGANEFALRDLVHKACAEMLQAGLRVKKTAMTDHP
jgi:hypothetical protein